MLVKLRKLGDGLGIQLPRRMLDRLGLAVGSDVELALDQKRLMIRRPRRRPTLDEPLDQCGLENRPEPIDWGPPVGRKII